MKDKAALYKQQNPHKFIHSHYNKATFKVLIGTYESSKMIEVRANNLTIARSKAEQQCKSNEEVIQVSIDNKIIWKHGYLR